MPQKPIPRFAWASLGRGGNSKGGLGPWCPVTWGRWAPLRRPYLSFKTKQKECRITSKARIHLTLSGAACQANGFTINYATVANLKCCCCLKEASTVWTSQRWICWSWLLSPCVATTERCKELRRRKKFRWKMFRYFFRPLFLAKKNPGGHGDTVEKGLGPRPLGPIGPIFRRTMTVTGEVQFLEGPWQWPGC